ncbi:MAG: PTS system mannose/fructose/sorbose family transporter subunit IID [Erysipelotrichaceae bacterium]|uniref:PTS system mannose/fructose/sorbose family transporter subunit IID n=1 Tax=Anaerorhabdus sp. TaxID=1872524 RepID=UPI002FCB4B36
MSDKIINKRDLNRVFRRGIAMQFSWNYERMQALGYCWTILPVLKKLYKGNPDGLKKAVVRNLEFFNTHPFMAMPIMGTSLAMEEKVAEGGDIDGTSISAIKVAMMGPFAGIGDSFFWFTLFPVCAGIGVSLSKGGSVLGPLAFLVLFNIFNLGTRYFGLKYGYKFGNEFIEKISGGAMMQRLSEGTTLVGLMVLGVMTATMVTVPLDFVIGEGEQAMSLKLIFDGIMPNIVPLLLTLGVYKLIKKGMSTTAVLFSVIGIAILGAVIGLF